MGEPSNEARAREMARAIIVDSNPHYQSTFIAPLEDCIVAALLPLLTERDAARRDAYREAEALVRPWLFKVPYEQRPAMRDLLDDLHRRATTAQAENRGCP